MSKKRTFWRGILPAVSRILRKTKWRRFGRWLRTQQDHTKRCHRTVLSFFNRTQEYNFRGQNYCIKKKLPLGMNQSLVQTTSFFGRTEISLCSLKGDWTTWPLRASSKPKGFMILWNTQMDPSCTLIKEGKKNTLEWDLARPVGARMAY